MEGLVIDDLFALTHCAFINPFNPTELVTANGLVGVLGRSSGSSKQLYVVSDKGKVNTKDPTQTFDVIRPLYANFSQDGTCLQLVSVIGEVEMTLNRRQVKSIFLGEPINFPGSPWKHHSTSGSDNLIDFVSSQRDSRTSSNGASMVVTSKPNLSTTSIPPLSVPSPSSATKAKPKAGVEEASFLARLKQAPEIQQSLSDFVKKFTSKPPQPEDQGKVVRGYLDDVVGHMLNHRAWSGASMEEAEIAMEAAEKYVMQKIYKYCFSSTPEDITRDKWLNSRFGELQFITQDHLDISAHHRDAQRTNQAIEELRQINTSKTPRGKLTRILNCCKAIYAILNRAAQQGHIPAAGADEFLPLLNYVVLKANPAQLHSNVQFILRFRAPNKMITEAGYYFTHLESTITWLENVNASMLTIDEPTFNSLLKSTQEAYLASHPPKAGSSAALLLQNSSSSEIPSPVPAKLTPQMTAKPSNHHDLLDLSGLSDSMSASSTPTPVTPSPTPSPLLDLWHTNNTSTSGSGSFSPASLSRVSSGNRSITRDDESSEASVLELQDSESPLRFLNYSSVEDVRIGELEDLFQAYRMLAHENFQLRTDLYRNANKFGP